MFQGFGEFDSKSDWESSILSGPAMKYKPRKAIVIGIELHDKNGVVQPDVGLVLRLLPHDGEFYVPEEQSEASNRSLPAESE